MLNQIYTVGLKALKRFLKLASGFFAASPIDLRHQKRLRSRSVLFQGFSHPEFAHSLVVIPGVVEKIDSPIHRRVDDTNCKLLFQAAKTKVPTTHSNS